MLQTAGCAVGSEAEEDEEDSEETDQTIGPNPSLSVLDSALGRGISVVVAVGTVSPPFAKAEQI